MHLGFCMIDSASLILHLSVQSLSGHSISIIGSILVLACGLCTAGSSVAQDCIENAFGSDIERTKLCIPLDHWQTWAALV